MTRGFKKWKENTTTFPSTRHLGHYKSFLVYDRQDNDPDHCSFNHHILQTINTIINETIESENPLQHWLSSIVIMIEKNANNPRINKIRIINIYEAYYNLLKNSFGRKYQPSTPKQHVLLRETSEAIDPVVAQTTSHS